MMRVMCVAGARPNFMKIHPVMTSLEKRSVDVFLVHTGQHYDSEMSDLFFDELGIRAPDRHLGVGSGTHADQTGRVMTAIEPVVTEVSPDALVVVGDVNSTMAAALVGAKAGCMVAHVEAGLRSRDWAMPEEINRVVTDRVSDLLFAPSQDAVDNLRREGYREDQIHLVGNVMIDTLLENLDRARSRPILQSLGLQHAAYGLVTLHRPSNVDDAHRLEGFLMAMGKVGVNLPLVFPAHPRTQAQLEVLKVPDGVMVIDPVGYLDFIALEASAALVMTDSGGVQEETTVLGVPCLTLRDSTERPITLTQGTNRLVGHDPERIASEALTVLLDPPQQLSPALWDGHAGERIADVLLTALARSDRPRPSDVA